MQTLGKTGVGLSMERKGSLGIKETLSTNKAGSPCNFLNTLSFHSLDQDFGITGAGKNHSYLQVIFQSLHVKPSACWDKT